MSNFKLGCVNIHTLEEFFEKNMSYAWTPSLLQLYNFLIES